MARKQNKPTGEIKLDLGELYDKQWKFVESTARYTAYGGARGGGKSHVLIRAAIRGALKYPGIKILIMRRTYPELEQTIIQPMNKLINSATMDGRPCGDVIASYNGTMRMLFFANGSTIKFGHLQSAAAVTEYQGQEYDWIFMDEATNFSENEFRTMGATLRGVNDIPKHFYLTCNPGGIGHQWVKRLFITREYEGIENGKDYYFIPATVEDNKALMKSSPEYIQMLDTLPDDIRAAHRYGDWDAMAGQFFSEFRKELHVVAPFTVPDEWPKYRAFDYGLDMFACYWFAIDFQDRVWVYREYCESGLIVSEAAAAMRRLTPPNERIQFTVAPPDMWTTQKDTGRTMAEVFMQNGIGLVSASNQRVQGWMIVKEFLKVRSDGKPGILFTTDCPRIIRDLPALQHDEKNPSDCAKEPHDITHTCVSGDTLIRTTDGDIPIKDLVGKTGECYCWDGENIVTSTFGYAQITRPQAELFEVELDTGAKFKATADHRVLTVAGWKEVKDLTPDDEVLSFDLHTGKKAEDTSSCHSNGNIVSIKPAGVEPVYNMTVEKHHNYLIAGNIILKNCDGIRYGLIYRTMGARLEPVKEYDDDEDLEDYDEYMTGGDVSSGYLSYGG